MVIPSRVTDAGAPGGAAQSLRLTGRHVPDLLGVLANGTIRREPANIGCVEHAGTPPRARVSPAVGNPVLRCHIGFEICCYQEVVVTGQFVDQLTVSLRFLWAEYAISHRVQYLLKCRLCSDGLAGTGATSPALGRFLRGQSEDEDVVSAHTFENLDVRSVQRADSQGAVQRQLHVSGA